jgi:YrbI family 3-deoxy-D-manno-octulosonate 8-phosphate phosphatase
MIDEEILRQVRLVFFDFDGVFTDNTVYVTQEGVESVRCWRSDGLGLMRLNQLDIKAYIISTEKNPVVAIRARKLNIPCEHGVDDKKSSIIRICDELKIPLQNTMFVGNDINDISAFNCVGLPVAVADAHPEINYHVHYKTKKSGGFGAVREICDLLYDAVSQNSRIHES